MADGPRPPEQEAEAQRLFELLQQPFLDEVRRLARLLASKPDDRLLGPTEFEVRDAVHRLGARALDGRPANSRKQAADSRSPI
jgi:hypothetical protein